MLQIKQSFKGHTSITYKGKEIARHNLSATTNGTREAFNIPDDTSVMEWIEKEYSEQIKEIGKSIPILNF